MTTLKYLLNSARQHERGLLLRAAICILYAHWEGFVRAVATSYVSFVASRGLRYRDLTSNFVALGFRSEINRAGQSNKPTLHTELTARLMSGLSEDADIDWQQSVNTGSNLNTETLNEILCVLGLDSKDYLLKRPLLDQRLLANRNLVAHGRRLEIEPDDYAGMQDEIIQLVERFRTDIQNAAVMENFRRQLDQ